MYGMPTSVSRRLPIGANAGGDIEWNRECHGMFHGVLHERGHLPGLTLCDLNHQFVVNLQDDATVHVLHVQRMLGADHRQLHDVGG